MITRTMIFASIGINRINSCQTINATIEITGSLHSMSVSEDQQKSSVTSRFWTWYLPIHTKLPSSCSARNSCSRHHWGLQLQSPHSPILGHVNLSSWVAKGDLAEVSLWLCFQCDLGNWYPPVTGKPQFMVDSPFKTSIYSRERLSAGFFQ